MEITRRSMLRALTVCGLTYGCSETPAAPVSGGSDGPLERDYDPVVLTGDNLPTLTGIAPGQLVGFRFEAR